MRVLQVIAEMVSGGAEAVVEELALGLPSLGHQVGVASAGGRREQVVRAAGAQLYPVPLAGRSLPGPVRTATAQRRAARQFHPDVLHAHNVVVAATAHLGVRLLRRRPPMLVTFHGVPAARYARAAQVLDAVADGVVVVAPSVGDSLRAAGLHRVPVVVVPNAVSPPDVGDRTAARAAVRTELGLAEDTPVAVCVARLVPQKRHDVLVDALALADPRLVVLAVGTGPDLDAVAARAAAAGLGDRLRLLGERADVPRLLAAADAVRALQRLGGPADGGAGGDEPGPAGRRHRRGRAGRGLRGQRPARAPPGPRRAGRRTGPGGRRAFARCRARPRPARTASRRTTARPAWWRRTPRSTTSSSGVRPWRPRPRPETEDPR